MYVQFRSCAYWSNNFFWKEKQNIMVKKEGEVSNIMSNYFTEITKHTYLQQDAIKPPTTFKEYQRNFYEAFKNHENIERIK